MSADRALERARRGVVRGLQVVRSPASIDLSCVESRNRSIVGAMPSNIERNLMVGLLAAGLACGCAPVNARVVERVTARGEVVKTEVSRHPQSDLTRATACLCEDRLSILAVSVMACSRSERHRVAIERDVIRDAPAAKYEALAAGLLVAAGSLLAWRSHPGCDDSNPPSCSGSDAVFSVSLGAVAAGSGLGVAAAIDTLRARDSKETVQGIQQMDRLEWCGEAPAARRAVTVLDPASGRTLTGETDAHGVAEFKTPSSWGSQAPLHLLVSVDGARALPISVRGCCCVASAR